MLQGWFIHFNGGLNTFLLICLQCPFALIITSSMLPAQTYYKNSSIPNCSHLNLYENKDINSNFQCFDFKITSQFLQICSYMVLLQSLPKVRHKQHLPSFYGPINKLRCERFPTGVLLLTKATLESLCPDEKMGFPQTSRCSLHPFSHLPHPYILSFLP